MVSVYYREKIQIIKISQGRRHIDQGSGGVQAWSFHVPSLHRITNGIISSWLQCATLRVELCQPVKLT